MSVGLGVQGELMLRLLDGGALVSRLEAVEAGVSRPLAAVAELIQRGVVVRSLMIEGRGICYWIEVGAVGIPAAAKARRRPPADAATQKTGVKVWAVMRDGRWATVTAIARATMRSRSTIATAIKRFRASAEVKYKVLTRPAEEGMQNEVEYRIERAG